MWQWETRNILVITIIHWAQTLISLFISPLPAKLLEFFVPVFTQPDMPIAVSHTLPLCSSREPWLHCIPRFFWLLPDMSDAEQWEINSNSGLRIRGIISFIHSFIHTFIQHLMSIFYVPDTGACLVRIFIWTLKKSSAKKQIVELCLPGMRRWGK